MVIYISLLLMSSEKTLNILIMVLTLDDDLNEDKARPISVNSTLKESVLWHTMPGYFETQVSNNCAVHAVNNLMQSPVVSSEFFHHKSEILTLTDNLKHHNETGFFDTDTLYAALEALGYNCCVLDLENIERLFMSSEPFMIIITHELHHFSARRFVKNSAIWIFDSLSTGPVKDNQNQDESLFLNILRHIKEGHIQRATQIISVQKGNSLPFREIEFIKSSSSHSLSNSIFKEVNIIPFPGKFFV